jgi:hypothetical protein
MDFASEGRSPRTRSLRLEKIAELEVKLASEKLGGRPRDASFLAVQLNGSLLTIKIE